MEINRYTMLSIGEIMCYVHSEFLLDSIQPGLLCHPTFVLDLFLHLVCFGPVFTLGSLLYKNVE